MSERETCWLVESGGPNKRWIARRSQGHHLSAAATFLTKDINEARIYSEPEAQAVSEALRLFANDSWRAIEHTFDPPKTPGQRLHEAVSHSLESINSPWVATTSGVRAKWEAAAAAFLAGEPQSESNRMAAENAASTAAQRFQDQSVTNQQGRR